MAPLKLYGSIISRASRVIWMAEELGIDYDLETVNVHKGNQNDPVFRALNPNAKVPAIKDGDTVHWESLAINLYLARKYGGPLAPQSVEDEGRAIQWSMWALTEAEDHCVILIQKVMGIYDHDAVLVANATDTLTQPLVVIEGLLSGQDYLLGKEFIVADLNVASVLGALPRAKFDLGPCPKVDNWLKNCNARPAACRINEMRAAAMKS
ncbi:MAG: glutathione S-transferase family protein [Pseudomonadota bacterium]|nr:glutathione S-transferase family protein [Pseudomonadota bacterium]